MAHELNNPLTAILGVSDLMRERAADDATRRQTEIVLKQARRAAVIVQNLLAFARPSGAGAQENPAGRGCCKRQWTSSRPRSRRKIFDRACAAASGLPAAGSDPKLLHQVFVNLIINAEQAITEPCASVARLRVSVEHADGKIAFVFADDGAGISPENIGKIFDPFFTTKRPGGGTGLGLDHLPRRS